MVDDAAAIGKTDKAFTELELGSTGSLRFSESGEQNKLKELKYAGKKCLEFCNNGKSMSFQVTEGKQDATKWVCRCFNSDGKSTKKQRKRPSMVAEMTDCAGSTG